MAAGDRCSICDAERTDDARGGLCAACRSRVSLSGETLDSRPDIGANDVTSDVTPEFRTPRRAPSRSSADPPAEGAAGAGRVFGDYELVRVLGRGGMGVVYEARQVRLNRSVALKMVRGGFLADEEGLRRFQNEAEAVARLDHHGIVPIYEVGEHEGQRYFSMKLISGGSLVSRLDRYRGDSRGTAQLLLEVAEAVAHAHMRGILHRDLKPANILIDDNGRPHVTDFGVAKDATSEIEVTQSGAIVGTPSYMAPEQASGKRGAITTATDVYGLGGVLYTLLTGSAPFAADSIVETLDAVRTRDPDPPTKSNPAVPRDLETICLKCLQKDAKRRYASAQSLADDLRAWLESRPISARRVGASERAWLWCRRKPALAALAAAAVLAVVGGAVGVICVQGAANRALGQKNALLATANEQVEQRFSLAMDAIKSFYTGVSEDIMLRQKSLTPLRKNLLESARGFYRQMEGQLAGNSDRTSRTQLAKAYHEIGKLTRQIDSAQAAAATLQQSLDLRRALAAETGAGPDARADVAETLYELAVCRANMQQFDPMNEHAKEATAIGRDLVREHPDSERYRSALAQALGLIGLGHVRTSSYDGAMAAYREAQDIHEALAREHPDNNEYRLQCATIQDTIGGLLVSQHRAEEGRRLKREALRTVEEMAQARPGDLALQVRLAKHNMNLASSLGTRGAEESVNIYDRAVGIWEKLSAEYNGAEYFNNMAVAYDGKAKRLCALGRPAEELFAYEGERAAFERAREVDPQNPVYSNEIADCCEHISTLQIRAGRCAEAALHGRRAARIRQEAAAKDPSYPMYLLAECYGGLGDAQQCAGQTAEAQDSFEKSLSLYQELAGPPTANQLPAYIRAVSVQQRKLGRAAEAASGIRRALSIIEAKEHPEPETWIAKARCRAQLFALSSDPASGVTADEGVAAAQAAVNDLRRGLAGEYATLREALDDSRIDFDRIEQTRDLDPLRNHPEFKALMAELRYWAPAKS